MNNKIKYNYALVNPIVDNNINSFVNPMKWENSDGYILDQISGSVASYSLDKLKHLITKAIRVRRSSDDSELDIGFINGLLDIWTLLAFCGASSGYVKILYDSSGNGFDAVQNVNANQPRIVNSGVLDVDANGKVTIQTILANDTHFVITNNSILRLTTNATFNFVHNPNSLGESSGARILDKNSTTDYSLNLSTSNNIVKAQPVAISESNIFALSTNNINTILHDSIINSSKFYRNGIIKGSTTCSAFPTSNANLYILNRLALDRQYDGKISELIIFNKTLTDSERQKLERNQARRYGIVVA
jgi:hypothetical protein